jgi:hypothetical protein
MGEAANGNGGAVQWRWLAGVAITLVISLMFGAYSAHGNRLETLSLSDDVIKATQYALSERLTRLEVTADRTARDVAEIRRLVERDEPRKRALRADDDGDALP